MSRACPACANPASRTIETLTPLSEFVACDACALQFVEPASNAEPVFVDYSEAGRALLAEAAQGTRMDPFMTPNETLALERLTKRVAPGAPVLELCSESGRMLAALQQHGYHAMGVDPLPQHARIAEEAGYPSRCGGAESVPVDWPAPAALVLLESLVRYPDPVRTLRAIRERFPKVPLILTVPSPRRSLKIPDFDRRTDYPPHFQTRWTPQALQSALTSAGYRSSIHAARVNLHVSRGRWVHRVLKAAFWGFLRIAGELEYSYVAEAEPRS